MTAVMQAGSIALLCAVLALSVKKESAPLGWCLALAGGLFILRLAADALIEISSAIRELLSLSGLDSGIYVPVIRVAAIGAVVRLVGALCRDAGQTALAAKLELMGTAAAVAACLPLFRQVIQFAGAL